MLNSVLGAISTDMAIDLGTTNTRIYVAGRGVVSCEPSYVAILEHPPGERRILAVGQQARDMVGRAPRDIRVVRPVQGGTICDYEVVEALLRHLVVQVQGRRLWVGPRMAVAVPYGTTDMERRAARESAEAAGARGVVLVDKPLAAAVGSGLPVGEARGHMVVDMGGGATEVSVLSLGGIVYSRTVPVGGATMDAAIADLVRAEHGMAISAAMAEEIKCSLGSAVPGGELRRAIVKGRHLDTGYPRTIEIGSDEVADALQDPILRLAEAIIASLERIPPDLASDVAETGIVLTGGGSLLNGLDRAIGHATGMPAVVPDNALWSVVEGAGRMLEEPDIARAAV